MINKLIKHNSILPQIEKMCYKKMKYVEANITTRENESSLTTIFI